MDDNKKSRYPGYTPAQKKAHEKYMANYCEIKVRVTRERRGEIQEYAKSKNMSVTAFINAAIDAQMKKGE